MFDRVRRWQRLAEHHHTRRVGHGNRYEDPGEKREDGAIKERREGETGGQSEDEIKAEKENAPKKMEVSLKLNRETQTHAQVPPS